MLIRIGHEIVFNLAAPVAMQLMLRVHPSRQQDVRREQIIIEPEIPVESFFDSFGNRCERIAAPKGRLRLWTDAVIEDSGLPDPMAPDAEQWPVEKLPPDVMPFLMSSRYCEVDKLSTVAWELFGSTPSGWARVQAICDWVNEKVSFGYPHARWTKSASDVYIERAGVCRDYTHLAVALCRCLNIPARYTTGYLGDIGVPRSAAPMDFSAWFEVFLGGAWHTFDARHNKRRIGRIVMARGRDAVDVALTTSYGPAPLSKFTVWTEEIDSVDPVA
jgi:transglutaminase-like putative cysteine protease